MLKPLFAEPIYQVEDIISEEENEKLVKECYRLREFTQNGAYSWDCDIYTSFGSDPLYLNPVFDNLTKLTEKYVGEFKIKAGMGYDMNCDTSWFNIAGPGQYQEQHLHPGVRVSGIYYMKSPQGSSGTRFKAPYDNHMGELYTPESPYHKMYASFPKERSLLLFGSHIPHWVPLGENMEDRITVSSNWS